MLEIESLTINYGDFTALNDFSAQIPDHKITTVLGPSGCGKSTLLGGIAGIRQPLSGRINLNGRTFYNGSRDICLPPEKRNIGFVFQDYALWPHLSLAKNLDYPLRVRKIRRGEREQSLASILKLIHLNGKEHRYPHELSGGEQQRAALGRALITEPDLLILDEPLSNLDALLREEMQEEIRNLQKKLQLTILHVTHDQSEALAMSDHIILMNKGRLEQQGKARRIYTEPANSFCADFLGKSNLIRGKITSRNKRTCFSCAGKEFVLPYGILLSNDSEDNSQETLFSLRPEDIQMRERMNRRPFLEAGTGVINHITYKGPYSLYHVQWENQDLRVWDKTGIAYKEGDSVPLKFKRLVRLEN